MNHYRVDVRNTSGSVSHGATRAAGAALALLLAAAPLACGTATDAEVEPVGEAQSALTVSANQVLGGGLPMYQGFPQIAVNPSQSQRFVASAVSSLAPPNAGCSFGAGQPTGQIIGSTALFGSTDGGTNWTAKCAPWPTAASYSLPNANAWWEGAGSVAWDNAGNAYAAYTLHTGVATDLGTPEMSLQTASSALVIAKSTNTGQTWGSVSIGRNYLAIPNQLFGSPRLAIDNNIAGTSAHPGRKYVAMTVSYPEAPSHGKVMYVGYTDDMVSYTWKYFAPADGYATSYDAPSIAVAADGTVYVMWTAAALSCAGSDANLFMKSTDGGATWSSPVTVDTHVYHTYSPTYSTCSYEWDPSAQPTRRSNSYAWIDVDRSLASPYYGTIYMVTSDYAPGFTVSSNLDVFLRKSTNGGATWSSRLRVNDDNPTVETTQFLPSVSVDQSDATVHVAWLDSRNYPGGGYWDCPILPNPTKFFMPIGNTKVQTYYARSSNGGASFEANQGVTNSGANLFTPQSYMSWWDTHTTTSCGNAIEDDPDGRNLGFGDYLGVVATNRQVHPVWVDTRNSLAGDDVYYHEDIVTTTVTQCSAPNFGSGASYTKSGSSLTLTWPGPNSWGVGATGGTYLVMRASSVFGPYSGIAWASTNSYTYTPPAGTYYYRIAAKNNCTGTSLTPMTTTSSSYTAVTMP